MSENGSSHNLAIFSSMNGSTAMAVLDAYANGEIEIVPKIIIYNNASSPIPQKVEKFNRTNGLNIMTYCVNSVRYPFSKDEPQIKGTQSTSEAQKVIEILSQHNINHIALLGYMKKVHSDIIDAYKQQIVNTHPGLLPETKGLYGIYVQKKVLEENHNFAGQSLHLVTEEYDEGKVIAENRIKVPARITAEQLFDIVQKIEKANIARDLNSYFVKSNAT